MAQQELPGFLQRLLPAGQALNQAAIGGMTGFPQPPHISIRGNRFHLVDGNGVEDTIRDLEIDVIVVDANPVASRIFFGRAYNPDESEGGPPKCWSDNGVAPSQQAMEPQHPNCAGCPQAVWGSETSKLTGKGIPACSTRKKLAVIHNGELFQFVIPPGSTGNWKAYFESIAKNPNISLNMLKTTVSFDSKKTGILEFKPTSFISEEEAKLVWDITSDKSQTVKLVGTDDQPLSGDRLALVGQKSAQVRQIGSAPQKSVEERIVTLAPSPPAAPLVPTTAEHKSVSDLMYPGLPNGPVAGARQQLEASVEATAEEKPKRTRKPASLRNDDPAPAQAFGMSQAVPATTDDQLQALLANAVGFAKK